MMHYIAFSDLAGCEVYDKADEEVGHLRNVLFHEIGFRVDSLEIHMTRMVRSRDVLVSPQSLLSLRGGHMVFDLTRKELWNYPTRKELKSYLWDAERAIETVHDTGAMTPLGPWGTYLGSPAWYPETPHAEDNKAIDNVLEHQRRYRGPNGRLLSIRKLIGFQLELKGEPAGAIAEALLDPVVWHLSYFLTLTETPNGPCYKPLPTRFIEDVDLEERVMRFNPPKAALRRCPNLKTRFGRFDEHALWQALASSRYSRGA